ncbi:hypothetical protein [Ancrocorticia populi]|uniref:hypothetical protein n=1 Tax=Ancrocorticia populi TaxID=2175228 RepID=UPI0014024925|nr:hypothetical protein [Ancrocorticia populi]
MNLKEIELLVWAKLRVADDGEDFTPSNLVEEMLIPVQKRIDSSWNQLTAPETSLCQF